MHLQGDDIDHSNTDALCRSPEVQPRHDNSSSSSSSPRRANKRPRSSTNITRRTSISYEAHPIAVLEDLMDELEDLSEDVFKALVI